MSRLPPLKLTSLARTPRTFEPIRRHSPEEIDAHLRRGEGSYCARCGRLWKNQVADVAHRAAVRFGDCSALQDHQLRAAGFRDRRNVWTTRSQQFARER